MLYLTSVYDPIFYTLQGEGRWTGIPSVFIRLAGCNLQCQWCDTAYTWDWENYDRKTAIKPYTIQSVVTAVTAFPTQYITITGGEPLLQQSALATLVTALMTANAKYQIEIETNGTQLPIAPLDQYITQYNISPKLDNAGQPTSQALKPEVLTWFAKQARSLFKFVVVTQTDITHILDMMTQYKLAASQIGLMPEGTTTADLAKRSAWVYQACLAHGFRYINRLHVQLAIP